MRLKKYDIPYPSGTKEYAKWYYHNIGKKMDIKKDSYVKQNIKADNRIEYQQMYYIKNMKERHPTIYIRNPEGYRKLKAPDVFRVHKGKFIITFD
jgi:hypothetical protein